MTRARAYAVLAVVALASSTGCKQSARPDIPIYPDAQGVKGQGTMKAEKTTVFNSRWFTMATPVAVKTFYDSALLSRPGWTFSGRLEERFQYSLGKLADPSGGGNLWPVDESQPAGLVTVTISVDRALIDVWQAVPAK